MFLFGVILFVGIVLAVVFTSVELAYFVDVPSVVFLLIAYAVIIAYRRGFGDFAYALKAAFRKNLNLDESRVNRSINLMKLLHKSSYVIGGLGLLIGVGLMMFENIQGSSNIMFCLLVSCLTLIYGILVNTVFILPVQAKLSKKA